MSSADVWVMLDNCGRDLMRLWRGSPPPASCVHTHERGEWAQGQEGSDLLREMRRNGRMAGYRWVWNAEEQHPKVIELMLALSRDEDRETRNQALYFGLSTVRNKSEKVIRRLVEKAIEESPSLRLGQTRPLPPHTA